LQQLWYSNNMKNKDKVVTDSKKYVTKKEFEFQIKNLDFELRHIMYNIIGIERSTILYNRLTIFCFSFICIKIVFEVLVPLFK